MSILSNKIKKFIPGEFQDNEESFRKARVFVTCSFLGLLFYFSFAVENFLGDKPLNFWTCLFGFIVLMLTLMNFKKKGDLNLHANVVAMSLMIVMAPQIINSGGIFSPDTVWLALVPIFPFWFTNKTSKIFWTFIPLAWILFIFLFELFTESSMRPRTEELDHAYYFVNYFFLTVLFLAAFALDAHYEKSTTEKIKEKNADLSHAITKMTDNVRYARRVQKVLLGSANRLRDAFEEAFILYMPKDIVSGDFYWYGESQGRKIIVAADCTGHGVSGAFLTVMGISFLNEIVLFHGITYPDRILEELDIRFSSLSEDDSSIDSGMDLSIVCIKDSELLFAGAKSKLILQRGTDINVLKGTRRSLGYSKRRANQKDFELQKIDIREGDRLYMTSDGYQDQLSEQKHSKFMEKQFLKLLKNEARTPLNAQKDILKEQHLKWKGKLSQTDDILVVGLKV